MEGQYDPGVTKVSKRTSNLSAIIDNNTTIDNRVEGYPSTLLSLNIPSVPKVYNIIYAIM